MKRMVKEAIKEVLDKWKFPVIQETERCLVFRYQLNYMQVNILNVEDKCAISLVLAGIFNADTEMKLFLGLHACNDLNYKLLPVKLYIDKEADLIIAAEFFYQEQMDLEDLLLLSLQAIIVAKSRFRIRFEELEEEQRLVAKLEEEQPEQK